MAGNVFPVDAVTGTPSYTGRMGRQTLGALWTKASTRLLGARTGIHPAAGVTAAAVVTATSTTWTVKPHAGVLDLETNTIAGPYDYSFDANQTGSVTAADATNPRVDSIFVQLADPAEGDGTAAPTVTCVYAAGTPGTPGGARGAAGGPPNFPNTRCMELAQLNVPVSGGGSPSTSLVAPYAVAAGGITPTRTSAEYPASPYVGQYADDAALGLVRWDGTAWRDVNPATTTGQAYGFTTDANGLFTVTHGLGTTPKIVLATVVRGTTSNELTVRISARTSTTFSAQFYYNSALLASTAMPGGTGFDWLCQA